MNGIDKMEFTRFLPGPDGVAPAYYRMGELYFSTPEQMQQTFGSLEGQPASADLGNFASGGVTFMIGEVED